MLLLDSLMCVCVHYTRFKMRSQNIFTIVLWKGETKPCILMGSAGILLLDSLLFVCASSLHFKNRRWGPQDQVPKWVQRLEFCYICILCSSIIRTWIQLFSLAATCTSSILGVNPCLSSNSFLIFSCFFSSVDALCCRLPLMYQLNDWRLGSIVWIESW